VLKKPKHAFGAVAISITATVRMLRGFSVRTRRVDGQDVAQEQVVAEAAAIIAFVSK